MLKDLNKEVKPDLRELEIINSSVGCLIIYDEIKKHNHFFLFQYL